MQTKFCILRYMEGGLHIERNTGGNTRSHIAAPNAEKYIRKAAEPRHWENAVIFVFNDQK